MKKKMNKNINSMPNDKNASIRYLMKEMDPSEEVLMERAMMEDENLLIEVESMRSTLQRLDKNLPFVKPPTELTERIVRQAAKKGKGKSTVWNRFFSLNTVKYAAAATVAVLALITGYMWVELESRPAPADIPSYPASVTSSSFIITTVGETQPEPWVDNNNILRFQDRFNSDNQAAFDSILSSSTRKLTPLNGSDVTNPRIRSVQLTGSSENR